MPGDDNLHDRIAAYLEFQKELGIEGFYRRARSAAPPPGEAPMRAGIPGPVPPPEARAEEPSRVVPAVVRPEPPAGASPASAGPAPISRAALSGRTSQALNLFEAAPPKRGPETLDEIRADLGDCHRCKLAAGRKHIVFGQGSQHAQLVFVGEGPGADEDEQGLPFVGRAGQLLNKMIQFIEMKREDVYIANVVKCRPPGNRTPEKDEVEACSPFLLRQIEAIRPRLVCCLGAPAMRTLLGISEGISKVRGQFLDYGSTKAFVTFHPAYILRNPREEKILREDFESIRSFLGR